MRGPMVTTEELMRRHAPEIASGMQGLCEAIGRLGEVRDAFDAAVQDAARAGGRDAVRLERLRGGLTRACGNLTTVVGCLPNELWAVLLNANHVGAEEVQARLLGRTR